MSDAYFTFGVKMKTDNQLKSLCCTVTAIAHLSPSRRSHFNKEFIQT